jgi:hypothetical protein
MSQTISNGTLQKLRTISIARVALLGLPEWSYQDCLSGLIFLNSGFLASDGPKSSNYLIKESMDIQSFTSSDN